MAPGVAQQEEDVRLHNDRLGLHQLYYFETNDMVVFSNWLPILVELSGARKPDRSAWVSIILLGFPTPGRSQFEEIQSLPPFSSLLVRDRARLERSDPPEGGASKDPAAVVDAIASSLPGKRVRNVIYPLSGGWDSRLLAGIARQTRRRLETWTTSTTHNFAPDPTDIDIARTVAGHMRTRHYEITPSLDEQPKAIDSTLARFHDSTWLHSWLEPMAARVRLRGASVVDGLGAVWIKGFRQNPADDDKGRNRDVRLALWKRLGGSNGVREDVWSESARALYEDVGFQDFDDTILGFSEAHAWQTLSILTTRTARAVSLAPMRLFGPDVDTFLPLITPRTLDAALSPEIYRKRGIQLAQSLLTLADPALASMPSTNDAAPAEKRRAARPLLHPDSLQRFVEVIGDCEPALRTLAPDLARTVTDRNSGQLTREMSNAGSYRAILGVYAYATWMSEYSVVSDMLD